MRKLMTIMAVLFCLVTSAQYTPTGSKTRWINGVGLSSTRDTSLFTSAADTNIVTTWNGDIYWKGTGYWNKIGHSTNVGAQIHDSLYAVYQLKAGTSAGVRIVSNSGTEVALFGAGGGSGTTLYGGLNGVTGNFSDSIIASKLIIQSSGTRFSSFHSDYQTNTFAGLGSGLLNTPIATTQGRQNSFYGALAGRNNTTGYATDNFGYSAGFGQTTGGPNVNIGYQSAFTCDTCKYNVNLGTDAGYNNRVNNQIFIGFHAGKSISGSNQITGGRNIVLSVEGATNLTSGYENTIVGDRAAWSITTGYKNIIFGSASGYFNTTGYRNVFLGSDAGYNNVDGRDNIYAGFRAGYSGTSAFINTAIGPYALFSNTGGYAHVVVGYQAGFSITGGNYSTYLGTNAGYNASQKVDPYYSTAIGHGSYNTKDYQMVLGSSDVGETWLRGKVLVNTETNNGVDALQVNGSISATNLLSGTYTPTATVISNLGSITTYPLRYTRVGNVVTVTGMIEPSVTTANTQSRYYISLPIAPTANFTQIYYATGGGWIGSSSTTTIPIYIAGESGGVRVEANFTATSTGTSNQTINFSYTIAN